MHTGVHSTAQHRVYDEGNAELTPEQPSQPSLALLQLLCSPGLCQAEPGSKAEPGFISRIKPGQGLGSQPAPRAAVP